jgi:ornithine carbamoyltransferase
METLPRLGGKLFSFTPAQNMASLDTGLIQEAIATGNYQEIPPHITINELKSIIRRVDIVYVDTWVDMENFNDPAYSAERSYRIGAMSPFQLTSGLLEGSRALVLHDMPIHAGYEISREVVEAHIETILHQAENRRHAQNGILVSLL